MNVDAVGSGTDASGATVIKPDPVIGSDTSSFRITGCGARGTGAHVSAVRMGVRIWDTSRGTGSGVVTRVGSAGAIRIEEPTGVSSSGVGASLDSVSAVCLSGTTSPTPASPGNG